MQRAAFFLAKGSQLSPNDLNYRLKLGFIYTSAGQFKQALDEANFVLEKKPLDDEAPLLLAETVAQPKDIAAMRQRLQTMARSGDRATIEVALGNLALREQNLADAGTALKKAQALDPKVQRRQRGPGRVHLGAGRPQTGGNFFQGGGDGFAGAFAAADAIRPLQSLYRRPGGRTRRAG